MIYERVLGGMLLHNRYGESYLGRQAKWVICRATISEKNAQRHFDQAKAPAWCVEDDTDRHDNCWRYRIHLRGKDLSLLLACRQVHREAKHIPFSTNTFSFHTGELLHTFLGLEMPLGPSQSFLTRNFLSRNHHLAVCRIHLDIDFYHIADAECWSKIIPRIAEVLPNVWNINISFDQGAEYPYYNETGQPNVAREDAALWEALMQSLLGLASLPLRSATFDISDRDIEQRWSTKRLPKGPESYATAERLYRWTLAEKQSRAKAVKEAILKSSS